MSKRSPLAYEPKAIQEAYFFHDGEPVTPKEIFNRTYSGLDDLIAHNIGSLGNKGNRYAIMGARVSIGSPISNPSSVQVGHAMSSVMGSTRNFRAEVTYESGGTKEYEVRPRTNFSPTLLKRPNIVHLINPDDGHQLILREARTYDLEGVVGEIAREKFDRKLDTSGYEDMGKMVVQPPDHDSKIELIPEGPLVVALENLYDILGVPRVTPRIKAVQVEKRSMWYLRGFLDSVRDGNFDINAAAIYSGTLQGLGLMDFLDLDPAEYVFDQTDVINIDPDFYAHSQRKTTVDHRVTDTAKRAFGSIHPVLQATEVWTQFKQIKKSISTDVVKLLDGKQLHEFIPPDIAEDAEFIHHAVHNLIRS